MIVAVLVLLSLILMATTVFPNINVTAVALIGGASCWSPACSGFGVVTLRSRRGAASAVTVIEPAPSMPKEQWTMPPLALLGPPAVVDRAQGRDARRCAVTCSSRSILLIVKAVQLGGG